MIEDAGNEKVLVGPAMLLIHRLIPYAWYALLGFAAWLLIRSMLSRMHARRVAVAGEVRLEEGQADPDRDAGMEREQE